MNRSTAALGWLMPRQRQPLDDERGPGSVIPLSAERNA